MELWIRSQDKYTLMKIEEIQICENLDGTWFMNAGLVLGKYKTKERALEVLDQIQDKLQLRFDNYICGYSEQLKIIYQMPKE